ncbi:MAG: permease [Planctomycetes bacterium]|nr:permease [Planctomycetota bacterium]
MNDFLLLADGPGYQGVFTDFNTTFWSAALRIAQAMVAAAPFLVAGVLAAGVLRGMVGAERLRRILGVGHWSGPLRAWGIGILLPICSLGALPVARELRRAGVPSGTVLSFVLVAPVLNPVSIIYGLSHIAPGMLLYFAAGTFIVSVGIGAIWNRVVSDKRDASPEQLEVAPRSSHHRLAVVGHTSATALVGPAFVDYGLALLAVGFLGAFLPHASLQTGLTRDNALAPVIMGLIAIPVYVTPTEVMMHFGHIVRDGFSLGAAFALIVLGAGANVGVANWLRRDYGPKSLVLFVSLLIGSTLVIGLTADRTIVNGTAKATDHTHAFDPFTRLANVDDRHANIQWVYSEVRKTMTVDRAWGLGLLAVIAVIGVGLRLLGDRCSIDDLLQPGRTTTDETPGRSWNPTLSPGQLCVAGVLGVLAFATVGLYVFYPPTDDLIDDMRNVRLAVYDAVREQDTVETQRRLVQWRSHARKLPTSIRIRFGSVDGSQHESLDELLYSLKTLEEYVLTGRSREAKSLTRYVEKVYQSCCEDFRSRET